MAKCERPGCRAPALKGDRFCLWHRPPLEEKISPWAAYERFFTLEERDAVRQAAEQPGLQGEIGVARVAIMRLLESEENPAKLIDGIAKGLSQIVRAAKIEHVVSGNQAEDLLEATNRVLCELGFGPEA
jgi:hypothetical protein